METTGDAVPIAEQVQVGGASRATGPFTVSDNGVLVYHTGAGGSLSQLTWYDRKGKVMGTPGEPGGYGNLALSPEGTRLAVTKGGGTDAPNIWLVDLSRGRGHTVHV